MPRPLHIIRAAKGTPVPNITPSIAKYTISVSTLSMALVRKAYMLSAMDVSIPSITSEPLIMFLILMSFLVMTTL